MVNKLFKLFQIKPKQVTIEERPKSIQEAIERGLVKDLYLPGLSNATMAGNVNGCITEVSFEEPYYDPKPGILIQGHTFLTFPKTAKVYLNGEAVQLRNRDYVRLYDAQGPQ